MPPTFWDPRTLLDLHVYSPGFTCTTPILPKKKRGQPQEPRRRCQQSMISHDCKSQADRALGVIAQMDVVTDGVGDGVKQALVGIAELTACPHSHNKPGKSKAREVGAVWVGEVEAWVVGRKRELRNERRMAELLSGPALRVYGDSDARRGRQEPARDVDQIRYPSGQQQQDSSQPVVRDAKSHDPRVDAILAAAAAEVRHERQQVEARRVGNMLGPRQYRVQTSAAQPEVRREPNGQPSAPRNQALPQHPAQNLDPAADLIFEPVLRSRFGAHPNLVVLPAEGQIPDLVAARRMQAEYEAQIRALQERVRQLEVQRGPVEQDQPIPIPEAPAAPIHFHRYPVRQSESAAFRPGLFNIQPIPAPPAPHPLFRVRVPIPVPAQPQPYIPQRKAIEECFACYEVFEEGEDIIWCEKQCGQNIHRECFEKWNRLNDFAIRTCALCRAPWTEQP
ncbi:hypothetical protein WAI453_007731 [Rhynchosporium graminicola]